ncbi:MAG: hypothetical protein JWQ88_2756, partial [Rhodoferax sp.]|nr:hypothetical protein [Rhodoferax sp.]
MTSHAPSKNAHKTVPEKGPDTTPHTTPHNDDECILVLQGGGALGA